MSEKRPLPIELPLAGTRRQRRDASENRRRIVLAAGRLLAERPADAVSIEAIAAAADVGKGTIFRHFGDRAGLTEALLDESMRELQEGFLHGPPPLGPGAAPAERLQAFADALLEMLARNAPLVQAASRAAGDRPAGPLATLVLHVRGLLAEIDPELDAEMLAHMLLGALVAGAFELSMREDGADPAALQRAGAALLSGIIPPRRARLRRAGSAGC